MTMKVVRKTGSMPYSPRINQFTQTFWQRLAEGELCSTRCLSCHRLSFPPRQFCPGCGHRHSEWVALSAAGTLYATTTVHAAPGQFMEQTPYTLAIVDLDDGVRLLTRLQHNDESAVPDTRVALLVEQYDDGCLFVAEPEHEGEDSIG